MNLGSLRTKTPQEVLPGRDDRASGIRGKNRSEPADHGSVGTEWRSNRGAAESKKDLLEVFRRDECPRGGGVLEAERIAGARSPKALPPPAALRRPAGVDEDEQLFLIGVQLARPFIKRAKVCQEKGEHEAERILLWMAMESLGLCRPPY